MSLTVNTWVTNNSVAYTGSIFCYRRQTARDVAGQRTDVGENAKRESRARQRSAQEAGRRSSENAVRGSSKTVPTGPSGGRPKHVGRGERRQQAELQILSGRRLGVQIGEDYGRRAAGREDGQQVRLFVAVFLLPYTTHRRQTIRPPSAGQVVENDEVRTHRRQIYHHRRFRRQLDRRGPASRCQR